MEQCYAIQRKDCKRDNCDVLLDQSRTETENKMVEHTYIIRSIGSCDYMITNMYKHKTQIE